MICYSKICLARRIAAQLLRASRPQTLLLLNAAVAFSVLHQSSDAADVRSTETRHQVSKTAGTVVCLHVQVCFVQCSLAFCRFVWLCSWQRLTNYPEIVFC
jgi:hypothetical protein